jgi:hypothetical protein
MDFWPWVGVITWVVIPLVFTGINAGIEAIQKARAKPPAVEAPAEPAPCAPDRSASPSDVPAEEDGGERQRGPVDP